VKKVHVNAIYTRESAFNAFIFEEEEEGEEGRRR
jgi:hypothetical protein